MTRNLVLVLLALRLRRFDINQLEEAVFTVRLNPYQMLLLFRTRLEGQAALLGLISVAGQRVRLFTGLVAVRGTFAAVQDLSVLAQSLAVVGGDLFRSVIGFQLQEHQLEAARTAPEAHCQSRAFLSVVLVLARPKINRQAQVLLCRIPT